MTGKTAIVVGAGIAGIATAHYLTERRGIAAVSLVDCNQPMAFTSAQSGENYRNWWPHPVMTAFTDLSISLMEELSRASGNRFSMTRRGYALATRRTEIDDLIDDLRNGYSDSGQGNLRFHGIEDASYESPTNADWETAPDGVDIIQNKSILRSAFPSQDPEVATVIHIRRAGDVDGQQLGQLMLEKARERGLKSIRGIVRSIRTTVGGFTAEIETAEGTRAKEADMVFNAAGPFVQQVGGMLGYDLPAFNIRQQKIAFRDERVAIPRQMPFSIDLDRQVIDWEAEDRAALQEDDHLAWLAGCMPGGVHCKPDKGERGDWIKLGWACSREPVGPSWQPDLEDWFPEVVLRGAARLNPGLRSYYGRFPRNMIHYGGHYTMTRENWPLIGPAGPEGSFVVGALSGFGTMAACAAGWIAAAAATGAELPEYARLLGLDRYRDSGFVEQLELVAERSVL